jgi:hypothetical protein
MVFVADEFCLSIESSSANNQESSKSVKSKTYDISDLDLLRAK